MGRKIAESSIAFFDYLDQKPELEVTTSKHLIEKIRNQVNEPEKRESGDSDSSDGEMEREVQKESARDGVICNTSALDIKESEKLVGHKERMIQRQNGSHRSYSIRPKPID